MKKQWPCANEKHDQHKKSEEKAAENLLANEFH
jgi:hypothetical protein